MTATIKSLVRKIKSFPLFLLSAVASYRLTGRAFPLCVRLLDHRIRFKCSRHEKSKVTVRGIIFITSWFGNGTPVVIVLGENAELIVNGDLVFGPNVRISVGCNAFLSFGGRFQESGSGFTENVNVFAARSIEIGKDFLGSWGLFITDADHHQYGDSNPPEPVKIGDHVWMCPNSSVLKGACIGANSVVTQGAIVLKGDYPDCSLLGGVPARRIGTAKTWHR